MTKLSLGWRHNTCQSYCTFSSPTSMWSQQSAVQPSSIFWFWFTEQAAAKCAGHRAAAFMAARTAHQPLASAGTASDKEDSLAAVLFQGLTHNSGAAFVIG